MTPLVIDASIAVKWLIDEDGHAEAMSLLEQPSSRFHAPTLLLAEVANVFLTKARRGEVTVDHALASTSGLLCIIPNFHSEVDLVDRAVKLAASLGHPIYDCLYLACAERLGGRFITADRKLCQKLAGTAFAPLTTHLTDVSLATLLNVTDSAFANILCLASQHFGTKADIGAFGRSLSIWENTVSLGGEVLAKAVETLEPPLRAEILAIALAGREADGDDWSRLIERAIPLSADATYMVRALQPHALTTGLTRLRGRKP